MEDDEKKTTTVETDKSMEAQLGVLNRADGSCRYSRGKTMVIAAVFGPVEAMQKNEQADRASLIVQLRPAQGNSPVADRDLERFVASTFQSAIVLTMHPRTQIHIVVQVVNDDGGLLAAVINATSLALVDAAIPMHFVAVASAALIAADGQPAVLDASAAQEAKTEGGALTFVFDSKDGSLLSSFSRGSFLENDFFSALSLARSQSLSSVVPFIHSSFETRATFYEQQS